MDKIYLDFPDILLLKRIAKQQMTDKSTIKNEIRYNRLEKYGLVTQYYGQDPVDGSPKVVCVINERGTEYLIYRRNKIFNSVWLPIIVSVVTNLLISALKWLLPLILELF